MFDTHSHLYYSSFYDHKIDILEQIDSLDLERLKGIINVSTNIDTFESVINIDEALEKLNLITGYSLGVHPHHSDEYTSKTFDLIGNKISDLKTDKIVAIGEYGLDYYKGFSGFKSQIELFKYQLKIANDLKLTSIFHIRSSFDDFFKTLNTEKFNGKGVIHSFSGDSISIKKALDYNLYFGINGIITFTSDNSFLKAIREIPIDRLVIETDSPFLAPIPMRGKPNSPNNLEFVIMKLSEVLDIGIEELIHITSSNALDLFDIIKE